VTATRPAVPRPRDLDRPFVVGVFALQGDFAKHAAAFAEIGVVTRPVRCAADLVAVDALALPGGESTTMLRLLGVTGMRDAFARAVAEKPVLATCAGLILLARELTGGGRVPAPPLAALDIEVERNAYGTQLDSFHAKVRFAPLGGAAIPGVFIRAPRIRRTGPGVEVVATCDGEPVGVRHGSILALCFHPELTADRRLHRWFLAACCGRPAD
jgi:5'-phosphate synthase pdxT subunit